MVKDVFEEIRINTSLTNFINQTKVRAELKVENLNKINVIDENILFQTIGKKDNKSRILSKITGPKAKYFKNDNPGHTYPTFKTHKLNPEQVKTKNIREISQE